LLQKLNKMKKAVESVSPSVFGRFDKQGFFESMFIYIFGHCFWSLLTYLAL